ncbi:MAG: hypothetical protein HY925_06020 [Elusimicrobia bacterium]|nr:hypothetical protein [Elusimicrobiota bacterium]
MRPLFLLAALSISACAGGSPRRDAVASRPASAPAGDSAAWGGKAPLEVPASVPSSPSCANRRYRFTCSIPSGYVLTQEGPGPGTLMNFEKQVRGSEDQVTLVIRATALGQKNTLETFVERRVARDLKKAQGVAHVEKHAAEIGGRAGMELVIDRDYASGPYKSRVFCFQEGKNVFIIDQSLPAHRFDKEKSALDSFVESMAFGD